MGDTTQAQTRRDGVEPHEMHIDRDTSGGAVVTPAMRSRPGLVAPVVLAVLGLAAYANTFHVPFILDDGHAIAQNSALHSLDLSPLLEPRGVIYLTLLLNYALGGLNLPPYHAVNLLIHVCAAWALYGVVRRTLCAPALAGRFAADARLLALAVSAVWLAHPLQTQSVTYIIQRSESLTGLFYLLALYAFIRVSGDAAGVRPWAVASVVFCAAGMGCKPTMVTAPVMVLLYDRAFLAGSWREVLTRRWKIHVALFATLAVLAGLLLASGGGFSRHSVGAAVADTTPLSYALTQCGVVVRYIRLALWPDSLCFDYAWVDAATTSRIVLPAALVGSLLVATAWAFLRRPSLGFPGAWFFITLAPTSSLLPILDRMAEHRMYLPLAAPAVVVVLAVYAAAQRLARAAGSGRVAARSAAIVLLAVAVMLAALTFRRNADYRSRETLWRDVVRKCPWNSRGHRGLAKELASRGDFGVAAWHFREALRLRPELLPLYTELGACLLDAGELDEGVALCRRALALSDDQGTAVAAHMTIADGLLRGGDSAGAVRSLLLAAQAARAPVPDSASAADALFRAGEILERTGDTVGAMEQYGAAVKESPWHAPSRNNLAILLLKQGRADKGMELLREAIRIAPRYVEAHANLAAALMTQGDVAGALACCNVALAVDPAFGPAHTIAGHCLLRIGRREEAVRHFREAVRLAPSDPRARADLEGAERSVRPSRSTDGASEAPAEQGRHE